MNRLTPFFLTALKSMLYPLRFKPILKRYLWGGRRLQSVLHKPLGPGSDYAESWEIVDRPEDQSVVAAGPLEGATLSQLMIQFGGQLLGRHWPQQRFPLLFKFLDAHQQLSIQVHPDDAMAATLQPPDLGKTEAWVVIAAEPECYIYAGLKAGVDRQSLARGLTEGDCETSLERIVPKPGDCFFLPAGVVHALGPGLVVAEIQQSSNTTYRLFDWNRRGPDGRLRELHVEQALAAINYNHGPVRAQQPQPTAISNVERLVACDKFVLDRWQLEESQLIGGDDRCHILAVLEGSFSIDGDYVEHPLKRGDVVLVPASLGSVRLACRAMGIVLDAYLP